MKTMLVCYDVATLLTLAVIAFVFLFRNGHVSEWRQAVLTVGLIGVKVFGMVGSIAIAMTMTPAPTWLRGLLTAGCVVALYAYEHRFARRST
jgi:hypothetical protein